MLAKEIETTKYYFIYGILINPPVSFNLVDSSTETTGPEGKSQRTIR